MIANIPPSFLLIFGALGIPLFRQDRLKKLYLLFLPVASFIHLMLIPYGTGPKISIIHDTLSLNLLRLDKLSFVFALIFLIATLLNVLFSLHVRDDTQHVCGLIYAGSALGAVFSGDLLSLFVYWELTAIASVFLIWARKTRKSYHAGVRYLVIQVASGVILLAGIIVLYQNTKSLEFSKVNIGTSGFWPSNLGALLIFLAFGIKCAFPLLHNWLQDAYPEATPTGTVFLSAFTTKLAVYALARGFAGTESLIYIGAIMTAFPIFFAEVENDLRKVLAYSLNNQLGFMVVGIGIGSEMALNGTAAHAFCHILYKALLFMAMGAVLHRTGTTKATELGGLYKSMPITALFCIIGAASISAFPLFSGFVSKSMILDAAVHEHLTAIWIVLLFASAGVLHHSGIKIPFSAFFGKDANHRCKEAPTHMLVAMGITATLCILIGCFPDPLYAILPYPVDFQPYTPSHIITQLQLLLWSALAFAILKQTHLYPPKKAGINLDFDWFYRFAIPKGLLGLQKRWKVVYQAIQITFQRQISLALHSLQEQYGTKSPFARTAYTGTLVLLSALLLGAYLLFYYLH